MRYWGNLLGLILGIMSGGGVWGCDYGRADGPYG